ncbi:MAG: hypothetical protein Q9195_005102 [Heterodermia aff. obscurata]
MAENDVHNFSSSSPHPFFADLQDRLATLSASEALQRLTSGSLKNISTGLSRVDAWLQNRENDSASQDSLNGGLTRGHVTEVNAELNRAEMLYEWEAQSSGASADCSHPVAGPRMRDIILRHSAPEGSSAQMPSLSQDDGIFDNICHYFAPTLPHLLALLTHPSPSFPPHNTSLIVIDAVSSLFNQAFPKVVDTAGSKEKSSKLSDAAQWAASRRWAVMGDFIAKLGRLAATRQIAILLTVQTATRVYAEVETCLYPAVAGTAWDNGINARVVLFRDWLYRSASSSSQGGYVSGTRYAAVVKAGGVSYEGLGRAVPFRITKIGLETISVNEVDIRLQESTTFLGPSLKRKRNGVGYSQSDDGEVGSDEEYGWTEESGIIPADEEVVMPE